MKKGFFLAVLSTMVLADPLVNLKAGGRLEVRFELLKFGPFQVVLCFLCGRPTSLTAIRCKMVCLFLLKTAFVNPFRTFVVTSSDEIRATLEVIQSLAFTIIILLNDSEIIRQIVEF